MFKEIGIFDEMKQTLDKLNGKGILLIAGDPPNPMTIGWGTLGVIWNHSIFTIMVRPTRYTFPLIEKAMDFSVCLLSDSFNEQLAFCGSKSGRDHDKIKECGFTMEPGIRISTPYIASSYLHYECRIVHKHFLDPVTIDKSIDKRFYPKKDYHMVYYGEIQGVFSH
ncbi:MAG: flavin reductase [Bacteroidales bacterium]|nr:flavin reductase [Bacteroidales bacterium]MDD4602827.1 flavin reductase [Bacteroidales bacterium]